MSKKKYLKNIISCILVISMVVATGCGSETKQNNEESAEEIVLAEPAGVAAGYDYVTERNLYQFDIYNSYVSPTVVEYSFSEDQTFEKYGATPGAAVEPGDHLVLSQTKSIDKDITRKQEEIADFQEDHAAEIDALNKDIYDAKKREFEASVPVSDMLTWEPDEVNQKDFYDMWASLYMLPDGNYKRAIQNRMILEENKRQSEELYALDLEYKQTQLESLEGKIDDATISSDVTGEVVACNYYYDGDWISKDTPIVAVGDTNSRVLKTEYISKGNINKALDIYALIDGVRYELEYVNMEPEEYKRLSEQGETAYTTFNLVDPSGTVELGKYATVVVVKDRRTGVPCVPDDAIKKESDGYYVHLYDNGETKYVPVEIGMRDGLYAEVISGLNVGDKVLSEQGIVKGKNTAVLEKGDFAFSTEYGGFLYYPFSEWLVNPVENGTTYVKEVLVSNNEAVTEGQVLMTLEVIPDQVNIDRYTRQISRLEERLEKLKVKKYDYDARNITDRSLERSIISYQIRINRINRSLTKLKNYSGIYEIKAPYNGIILASDTVKAGDLVYADSNLIEIADEQMMYIIVQDKSNLLNYGNEATIKFNDGSKAMSIEGKVVTVNNMSLSKNLSSEFSLISIPKEEAANLSASTMGTGGRWDRSTYKVEVNTRTMNNVVLVPKTAVINKDKSSYVKVVKDDGTVEMVSFIPGGSDNNYYWVVDGLTEGMTICWE